ncbi:MAG: hypothetical protein FJW39_13035 [Acidobacteria bacterium]|nr:hypothetical protein [Acidobacteriota bacterium]
MMNRRLWLVTAGGAAAQSIDHEIRALASAPELRMRFAGGDESDLHRWQTSFRAKLASLLGPHEPPAEWSTVEESSVDLGDHVRQSLLLKAPGLRDLPVYLLTPKGSDRRAAVLALHGHGRYGHDPVAGVAPDQAHRDAITSANYDYGLQLVRRGYVVAAPCFTPFGRRLGYPASYKGDDPCGVTFIRMQLFGKILISENLRDALWSASLLARHPRVDPGRIACVGLSYGGRMTMLTAAMDTRIRAAVISGALNVMQERVRGRYSCGAQIIPGLLEYGDVPEIGSLIAPRPCVWEAGQKDALMVKEWLEPSLERMRRAWAAARKPENLQVDSFDGGHRWSGTLAYPMLERTLG